MTRTMYDSIHASAIPKTAEMVAGWVDGIYAWTPADWALFPLARKVRISVLGNPAEVADVENGALTIQQAIARGYGTVYCSLNSWEANRAAYQSMGKAEPLWWIADYDGVAQIPAGAIAKQYTDNPPSNPYDTSVVADYWPGVDPAPDPPKEEEDMRIMNDGKAQWLVFGGVKVWIDNPQELTALSESGIPSVGAAVPGVLSLIPEANAAQTIALSGTLTPA